MNIWRSSRQCDLCRQYEDGICACTDSENHGKHVKASTSLTCRWYKEKPKVIVEEPIYEDPGETIEHPPGIPADYYNEFSRERREETRKMRIHLRKLAENS